MKDDRCIILFVKSLKKGAVKSRLSSDLGETATLDLYASFVADMLEMLGKTHHRVLIAFHPPEARQGIIQWLGDEYQYFAQEGRDVGERMKNAFEHVFSEGFRSALLTGSDIPHLMDTVIEEAFESLHDNDAVIGPTVDGGYYLVGFNKSSFFPEIFSGIMWSTDGVFRDTMEILGKGQRTVHLLPKYRDIDTLEDLRELFLAHRETKSVRSRTLRYLTKHEKILL